MARPMDLQQNGSPVVLLGFSSSSLNCMSHRSSTCKNSIACVVSADTAPATSSGIRVESSVDVYRGLPALVASQLV